MNILIIGDIYGKPGREAVKKVLPKLKKEHGIDLVIANGENMAHGKGMTPETYRDMVKHGVDFFTTGNHIYAKDEILADMNQKDTLIIRPANFPPGNEGVGYQLLEVKKKKFLIINLIGQVFMPHHYDCPFRTVDAILDEHKKMKLDAILVDFHAEVTSEKVAMKHYLDGRVTALWGTHTHVPTADSEITDQGTAYITDVGMTGPSDSVIGADKAKVIESFLLKTKLRLEVASGPCIFNAILLELGTQKKAKSIQLIQIKTPA